MNRFFGMMPSAEIEIKRTYKDVNGYKIIIQAGKHGWTIIYADSSSNFEDIDNTANKNFTIAYNIASKKLGKLIELEKKSIEI